MIEKFQYITHEIDELPHWEQAKLVCQGGCKWIQLRIKEKSDDEMKSIAKKVQNVCIKYGATFIINDNVELAHEILADGIHLGKTDMSPDNARKILGDNFIIGGTANTFEDIVSLANKKVDYIGLGPFKITSTKKGISPVLGIEGYKKIISKCSENKITTPVIAIGGVEAEDIPLLLSAGIHGIAVSSGIHRSYNITEMTQKFYLTLYF